MTQLQYRIPTTTRFEYNETFEIEGSGGLKANHRLLLVFDWVSPVSNKTINSKVSLTENWNNAMDFYSVSENMMTNEYTILPAVANEMAKVLRQELEEGGGIDFEQLAKAKFEEHLKLTYDFNVFIDLNESNQDGRE